MHIYTKSETNSRICLCSAKWNSVIRLCSTAFVWKLLWLLNTILFIASSVNSDCTTTEYTNAYINSFFCFSLFSVGFLHLVLLVQAKKKSNWTRRMNMEIKWEMKKKEELNQELNNSKPLHSALKMSTYALHKLDNSNVLSYSVDLLLPVYALYSLYIITCVYARASLSPFLFISVDGVALSPLMLLLSFAFRSSHSYRYRNVCEHTAFSGSTLFILFLLDDFVVVFVSWRFRMYPECIEI